MLKYSTRLNSVAMLKKKNKTSFKMLSRSLKKESFTSSIIKGKTIP